MQRLMTQQDVDNTTALLKNKALGAVQRQLNEISTQNQHLRDYVIQLQKKIKVIESRQNPTIAAFVTIAVTGVTAVSTILFLSTELSPLLVFGAPVLAGLIASATTLLTGYNNKFPRTTMGKIISTSIIIAIMSLAALSALAILPQIPPLTSWVIGAALFLGLVPAFFTVMARMLEDLCQIEDSAKQQLDKAVEKEDLNIVLTAERKLIHQLSPEEAKPTANASTLNARSLDARSLDETSAASKIQVFEKDAPTAQI